MKKPSKNPTVRLKPSSYQPSKAELEEDVSIDATPEELRRAVMRRVEIETVEERRVEPDSSIE